MADLFRHADLTHGIELEVDRVIFSVATIGEPFDEFDGQIQARTMTAPDGSDGVRVDGRTGWLDLLVGQWSDQPDNAQIVLSSNRKELDQRFGQINLDLSLTDGRTAYLVKNLSKEGGAGSIKRLYGGAGGPAMARERAMRKEQLVAQLGNETITFDEQEWLVVAVLPIHIPRRRANALFTEAMVQFLRYAAHIERLRRQGANPEGTDGLSRRLGGLPHRLSAEDRRLIELEAMTVVRERLEERGYRVKDVASRESYDFEARRGQEVLYVEVKGTTSRPWSVELTASEHRLASQKGEDYSLWVVIFDGLNQLDRYEWFEVGNPLNSMNCSVRPVRYRVEER